MYDVAFCYLTFRFLSTHWNYFWQLGVVVLSCLNSLCQQLWCEQCGRMCPYLPQVNIQATSVISILINETKRCKYTCLFHEITPAIHWLICESKQRFVYPLNLPSEECVDADHCFFHPTCNVTIGNDTNLHFCCVSASSSCNLERPNALYLRYPFHCLLEYNISIWYGNQFMWLFGWLAGCLSTR